MIRLYPITPSLCSAAKAELDCNTSVTPPTPAPEIRRRCAPAKSRVAGLYLRCWARCLFISNMVTRLLDLEISDEELAKAFAELAARFRKDGHGTAARQPPARPAAHTPANGGGA